jgi:hypothetical protein
MRLRTPANDRELFAVPDFDEIPALVERNRSVLDSAPIDIDGIPLPELRRLARHELLGRNHPEPLIVTGHQPEPFHPGVWVKNFAANGLGRRCDGTAVNLIVDSDELKSPSIDVPTWDRWEPEAVKIVAVPFAEAPRGKTWESVGTSAFDTFLPTLRTTTKRFEYEPIAFEAGPAMTGSTVGERFVTARTHFERAWGCSNIEIPTSRMSRTRAFRHFANLLVRDAYRFRQVHNAAVREYRQTNGLHSRTHPVPELADGEVPFWHVGEGGRTTVTPPFDPDRIRPRALTLTLFARLGFADLFVHGIGGGKYDAVTDAIIRDYFGLEPTAFQVVSTTLRLPLPGFPATEDSVKRLQRLVRDMYWNPQRHGAEGAIEHQRIRKSPPGKVQYRTFRALGDRLRPQVADRVFTAERDLARAEIESRANAILRRRDYAWLLYPKELLREYLTGVQDQAWGNSSVTSATRKTG